MLFRKVKFAANDDKDIVAIVVGALTPRVAYQTAFDIAHRLRLAAKSAARHDRAPASFWTDVNIEDLDDCPRTHRGFRRSNEIPTTQFEVRHKGAEVCLIFGDSAEIFGYEDAIKLHQMIRRAGRRAKAWAGDTSTQRTMLANLTDGEENYRLGLVT